MRYYALSMILSLAIINIAGCGYHLFSTTDKVTTNKMKSITLNSYDLYGPLTRAIRAELYLNGMTLINNTKNKNMTILPSLRIINSSENKVTTSVFQDGKTAEYQVTLNIQAQVLISSKDYYPINVKVCRLFFNNPLTAIAKDAKEDIIRQELYQKAAQQLVYNLLMVIHSAEKEDR